MDIIEAAQRDVNNLQIAWQKAVSRGPYQAERAAFLYGELLKAEEKLASLKALPQPVFDLPEPVAKSASPIPVSHEAVDSITRETKPRVFTRYSPFTRR